ncbi:tyrosine-type recombinase/integrase [Bacteroides hominis]|uniref:tyrosine-type recombinase/integrase n=1 Tax=Bacteroides hominis TaxID=2763023 RepID=UPI003D6A8832
MRKTFNYSSVFAPYIRSFIKVKQDCGFNIMTTQSTLYEFDQFFITMKVRDVFITKELIEKWHSTRISGDARTMYAKYSVWPQFCKYLCCHGHECYIPRLPKPVSPDIFVPYIFSHKQINDMFHTSDSLRMVNERMSSILFVMPALLRLMYGTGVRVSEALSIRNSDVDLGKRYIIIRKTKNGEQRLIPLSDTLIEVVCEYIANRNRMPLPKANHPESFLFISPNGNCCAANRVYDWFRKILSKSGIPHLGNHKGPRVHDLRHTFAVHSLMKMVESGYDIYYSLPILSTYLGHKSIKATEQYVRLTMEVYPELLNDERKLCAYVFPKTIYENENN